jgi:hypothetical protein
VEVVSIVLINQLAAEPIQCAWPIHEGIASFYLSARKIPPKNTSRVGSVEIISNLRDCARNMGMIREEIIGHRVKWKALNQQRWGRA